MSTVFDLAFFNALVRTFLSHRIFWIELVGLLVGVVINFALNGFLRVCTVRFFDARLNGFYKKSLVSKKNLERFEQK